MRDDAWEQAYVYGQHDVIPLVSVIIFRFIKNLYALGSVD